MAVSLAKLALKIAVALLFQAVKYHGRWHTITME
jgi:hypothetical protein